MQCARFLLILSFCSLVSTSLQAQDADRKSSKKLSERAQESLEIKSVESHEAHSALPVPKSSLAQGYMNDRPVYFPDYYLFYTPRRGYIFWSDGGWQSSATLPDHLKKANLKSGRARILDASPENENPEKRFKQFRKDFPAQVLAEAVIVPED